MEMYLPPLHSRDHKIQHTYEIIQSYAHQRKGIIKVEKWNKYANELVKSSAVPSELELTRDLINANSFMLQRLTKVKSC